ncbi:YokU family protein [Robertmurraya yapensis]|uniref:YokU family protein n=2 Tax=Bacillaceae TaxID=186817 RepID=A0A431W6G4_9BACI|nr:YokU family protein [Bacillus yapensis]RTR31089.1 YokU family protein [Bacillus yapensis]TKS95518.1 YokU family protein [Bacillus yapensis]
MSKNCAWCNSGEIRIEEQSVYWELPDGTKAIEISGAPTVVCLECGMVYQEDSIVKEIEDQLFLINTKELEKVISYRELMEKPRLLKRNYFDFS